ncbi:MAG: dCTP deaminase [Candidatus Micrarchaeota archaeon]
MILSKKEILEEIQKGELKIIPFSDKHVGECSVDLTLGNEFLVLKRQKRPIEAGEGAFLNEGSSEKKVLKNSEGFVLKPKQMVLGITKERLKMPLNLCGWIQGRSRFARIGLLVHVSSSLIQPGVDNKQVLEIVNLSPTNIILTPGLRICQVVFEQLSSPQKHSGVFAKQTSVF